MIKLMQGAEEINSNGGFPFVRKLPQFAFPGQESGGLEPRAE